MVIPFPFSGKRLTPFRTLGFIGGICLFAASILCAAQSPDNLWDLSQQAFKNDRPLEACNHIKEWLSEGASTQVRSAEAFYNLSLCSWQLKEHSQSVIYGLKSLQLRNSIQKRWTDIKLLSSFQKEIGIRDNLPSRYSFIFRLLFPLNTLLLLVFAGLWLLVGTLLFTKNQKGIRPILIGSAWTCWAVALILYFFQHLGGPIAVISSPKETTIVEFDKSGNTKELMMLPPGTIVELGPSKNEHSQVLKPIGGWIKTDALETLIP